MPSTPVAGGSTGRPLPCSRRWAFCSASLHPYLSLAFIFLPVLPPPLPSPSSPSRTWRVCGWPAPGDGRQLPLLLSGALSGQAQSTGPPGAPTLHVTAEDAWCQGGSMQGQPGASWSQDRDPLLRRKGPGERSDRQGRAGLSAWRIRGQDFQLHVGARHGLHPGPGLQPCRALRVAELRCPPPGLAACTSSDTQPGWHSPTPPHDPGLLELGLPVHKVGETVSPSAADGIVVLRGRVWSPDPVCLGVPWATPFWHNGVARPCPGETAA